MMVTLAKCVDVDANTSLTFSWNHYHLDHLIKEVGK